MAAVKSVVPAWKLPFFPPVKYWPSVVLMRSLLGSVNSRWKPSGDSESAKRPSLLDLQYLPEEPKIIKDLVGKIRIQISLIQQHYIKGTPPPMKLENFLNFKITKFSHQKGFTV